MILLVAAASVSVLVVNSYDNAFQARASWNVFMNHRWPMDDPAEQERTLYGNPPHSAIYTAPFVLFGPHVAAFFGVVFVMILFVGERRGAAALLTLLFVLSPPVMFLIAEAGLTGVTTGLGLIFLLADKRGPMRAFAWAMLTVRPHDTPLVVAWSGLEALRQKDWKAIVLAVFLVLPTLLTLDRWLSILPTDSSQLSIDPGDFYTLSIPLNSGIPAAILFLGLVLLFRGVAARRTEAGRPWPALALRRPKDFSRTEFFWLLSVIWLMLMPYYLVYMMWIVMFPVREYGPVRTLLLFVGSLAIGFIAFRDFSNPQLYYGGLLLVVLVTVLTPKPCASFRPALTLAKEAA
ncbi:MAG TPA: hypothetical protein VER79_03780 [Candidatus Limnocylindrales bacterium]|nr:hypothetical protein [Candidatus Limnocylindrales bacterium]